jgi:predicted amidohydrolase YtcJ
MILQKYALSICMMGLSLGTSAYANNADAIYFGGPIVTIDDKQPNVEAVAVKNGKIIAVGARSTVEKMQMGPKTQLIDLAGKTMLPGFIDAHSHMGLVGLQSISANLLPPPDGGVDSIAALQKTLRDWIASSSISRDFGMIIGFGYDDSQLKEQRHPTAEDLDEISMDLPIVLVHQSTHLFVVNSKALQLAGVSAETKNPPGGIIRRKPGSNVPNGVLEETAGLIYLPKITPKLGMKEQIALLEAGQNLYMKYGHTTAQEGRAMPGSPEILIAASKAGKFKIDVVAYPDILLLGDSPILKSSYVRREYKDGFRIGGVKVSLDGSPQGKTAWITKPYYQVPEGQKTDYKGYATITDDQAIAAVSKAFKNNWQILAHTNGDAATDQLILAVKTASKKYPGKDRRPVMIHGQTMREDQVLELKALKIFPSLFPMHTYYWGDWYVNSVLGQERAQNISPTGWLMKNNMMFSSHHDAPVALPDTLRVLSATVNRTSRSNQVIGPQHRVEPITGLKAMTLWAAYQHFEEKSKGSIEVGKLADFVILSDNPLTIDRTKIADIKVLETIKKGKSVYKLDENKVAVESTSCLDSPRCSQALVAYWPDSPLTFSFGLPHRHAPE